jgi:hypothetical protein
MAKEKQEEFNDFRPPKIRAVDECFHRWLDAKLEHEEAKKKSNDRKEKLHDMMKEHKVPMYSYRGWVAQLQDEEKVLISKAPREAQGNGEKEEAKEPAEAEKA